MTAKRKTSRKPASTQVQARDPKPKTRDPRRYIPASMPTVCPDCGHNTRMFDGRHIDPVAQTVLEYRTCIKCGAKLCAGRDMTKTEIEKHCTGFEQGVKQYQETAKIRTR
jgi:ribosomal protein S27E